MRVYDIEGLCKSIEQLRRTADELKEKAKGIPAVEKNVDRILASVRMLELSVSDASEFL